MSPSKLKEQVMSLWVAVILPFWSDTGGPAAPTLNAPDKLPHDPSTAQGHNNLMKRRIPSATTTPPPYQYRFRPLTPWSSWGPWSSPCRGTSWSGSCAACLLDTHASVFHFADLSSSSSISIRLCKCNVRCCLLAFSILLAAPTRTRR